MQQKPQSIRLWAVVFWLIVWQLAAMALRAVYPHGALLLASPLSVLRRLIELAGTAAFWRAVFNSTAHILGGFLIACVCAVAFAALSARFRRAAELLAPLIAVVKSVPVASFIILALLWLSGRTLALFIAALIVFPPIYANVLEGIRRTDASLLEMARVFRVPARRQIAGIYLPQTLPYFRSAVRTALGLCWKAGAAAEVIGLSSGTIGERLYTAKVYFQTADLFAWTAVIVLLSALFERLFLCAVNVLAERMGCDATDRK